jgi:proline racemase
MKAKQIISTIDTHTEGEPTRIVTSGLANLKGNTMPEKRQFLIDNYDYLRTTLISEPRGHKDMFASFLTPPINSESDFGVLYAHNSGYMDMCGHATIGTCTALIEAGMVEAEEPITNINLDTPDGLVTANVSVVDGKARSVSFQNVPAYVHALNVALEVDDFGKVNVDIAYGGNHFAYFNAEDLGIEVSGKNARQVIDVGMAVRKAVNEQVELRHPVTNEIVRVNIATILAKPADSSCNIRNVHVFGPRQFDRSPGGTGTSARLAVLYAKGNVGIDEQISIESGITEAKFNGRVISETMLGDKTAVITEVTGSAHITGMHQFIIDPDDRLKHGFLVEDV